MIATEIRPGVYFDSVVLMQIQRALCELPGVSDAAVMMGTGANLELLREGDLYTESLDGVGMDDLVIAVRASSRSVAESAVRQFDTLVSTRASVPDEQEYLPKTLSAAAKMMPAAGWVVVSVPGQYAASVAQEAISLGKHVFLYSDNVGLQEEVNLKRQAMEQGQLLLGPDCGTAIINGIGLGFANAVRRGRIGLVSASGTGLQHVAASIHNLGGGVSHALGTGGRDLSDDVGGLATLQCLHLLAMHQDTDVLVLISKPPSQQVSARILSVAARSGKPTVIYFIGHQIDPATRAHGQNLHFANSLADAAVLALKLAQTVEAKHGQKEASVFGTDGFAATQKFMRGLFSGGTLALECRQWLTDRGLEIETNLLGQPAAGHTILDLGDDAYTVGRLHPMLDNDLRIRRLRAEAHDPEVAVILLDCVLGYGAHPDPASDLAPAIGEALAIATQADRRLEVLVTIIGTEEDPQDLDKQQAAFEAVGAHVYSSNMAACEHAASIVEARQTGRYLSAAQSAVLNQPFLAINVGLASFAASIQAQGGPVQHVEWRPPASGNEKLAGILARMKH